MQKLVQQSNSVSVHCATPKNVGNFAVPQQVEKVLNRIKEVGPKVAQFGCTLAASAIIAGGANALTYDDFQGLTYLQIKGSGLANTCPILESGTTNLKEVKPGNYSVTNFCLEPTSFTVKEDSDKKGGEPEFVKTKLVTRLTYTLADISASMTVGSGGEVTFQEEDGIDFAPVTVQLPGGERVAFLFTVKQLDAKGTLDAFQGTFNVPSYRGSSFLDPRGRGGSAGYEAFPGLPSSGDSDEYQKENVKSYKTYKGQAVFSVAKYDQETGEIAGVFQSIQTSDTDQGTKVPKDVKVQGLWYGRLNA